ncbi:type II secretion system protein GspL [Halopseudomonas salegens]|uniref:Type II secretion system protein L n=1 Tax=Halopseudomonas salegens TaxID=1434072 RepID=A0A1H2GBL4_9GAMM|nr:type II secretion system protein GspL [Halopseudomonas salegens]SDU16862.1 general secretion pathway protein L [Halopseudomonas salegens]
MLIVLLPDSLPAPAEADAVQPALCWWQLERDGSLLAHGVDSLADLHARFAQTRVRALAPAMAVSLYRITMPARRGAAQRAALPYALEDQLSEDIDGLHFVAGPRTPNDELVAAVVSHDLMQQWQALLQLPGWRLEAIVPAPRIFSPLAPEQGVRLQECVWPDGQVQVVLTAADQEPQLMEPELVGFWLQRRLHGEPELAIELLGLSAGQLGLSSSTTIDEYPAKPLDWATLLRSLQGSNPACNLLTGAYATSLAAPPWRKLRPVMALAAAIVLLVLAQVLIEWRALDQERDRLQVQMLQIFSNSLPSTPPVDPVNQFREVLSGGAAVSGGPSMGPLLHDVLQVVQAHADAQIVSLRGTLTAVELELQVASFAELESIRAALSEQPNLREDLQGADSTSDGVSARLRVQRSES